MQTPTDRTRLGDLRSFRDPHSVAVVGASDDPAKWGYWIAQGALLGTHRRTVWLVNRSAGEVQGHPAHASVAALPGTPELVEQINGGNQTVPTVVYPDGSVATNPSLRDVQTSLAR